MPEQLITTPLDQHTFIPIPTPIVNHEISESQEDYVDTYDDLNIKYDSCYGILSDHLIFINGFKRGESIDEYGDSYYNSEISCSFSKLQNGLWIDGEEEARELVSLIDWTLPKLGAVNYKDTVIFCSRRHKQSSPGRYRRAFRGDILYAFEPTAKEYSRLGRSGLTQENRVSSSIINNVFFKEYYSTEEALSRVINLEVLGAAFSEDFYFTVSSSVNTFLLWRGDIIIGTYSKVHNKFKMITTIFNSELRDYNVPIFEELV